jgi:hypothetical protein
MAAGFVLLAATMPALAEKSAQTAPRPSRADAAQKRVAGADMLESGADLDEKTELWPGFSADKASSSGGVLEGMIKSVIPWRGFADRAKTSRLLLFSSMDSGPGQIFSGIGLKYAPFGPLDESGFRVVAKAGTARWQASGARAREAESKGEGYAMLGGELMTGRGAISISFGPEAAMKWSPTATAPPRINDTRTGLRLQAELWDHPTPVTLLQFSTAASTATAQLWARAATGYQFSIPVVADVSAFAGPEAEVTSAPHYTKWRVGAHVTGLQFLGFTAKLSAGREYASDRRSGFYATLGVHWRR